LKKGDGIIDNNENRLALVQLSLLYYV